MERDRKSADQVTGHFGEVADLCLVVFREFFDVVPERVFIGVLVTLRIVFNQPLGQQSVKRVVSFAFGQATMQKDLDYFPLLLLFEVQLLAVLEGLKIVIWAHDCLENSFFDVSSHVMLLGKVDQLFVLFKRARLDGGLLRSVAVHLILVISSSYCWFCKDSMLTSTVFTLSSFAKLLSLFSQFFRCSMDLTWRVTDPLLFLMS